MYHRMIVLIVIITTTTLSIKANNVHPDAGLDITQLLAKYGYPSESHHVQTDDGYILTLHRIPHGLNNTKNENKPAVLLMHGLLCSSVEWVNMGPQTALGLLLADNGYDVWLGNQRGNTWSRKHVVLDPDQDPEKFFDFSFHEIGVYDLPAKIDYILSKTGQKKIFYIGHSQGTTAFFVMASERPEYNKKISLMTALAPVVYTSNLPNPFLQKLVDNYELVKTLIEILKVHELLPHFDFFTDLGNELCHEGSEYQSSCSWFLNLIAGFDSKIDPNFIPVISSNAPAGASIKQIMHYLQEIRSGNFGQYDYETNNIEKYSQKIPPVYDLNKITSPVSLYYADNDWLSAVEDVLALADKLSNLEVLKKVSWNHFNHLDFLWARDVVDLLYNDVISEIKSRSNL